MERTIQQHINDDLSEINNPNISSQRRRHLEDEVDSLEKYQENHPGDNHDPTPLELFCNLNPDAPECLMYD